MSSDATRVILSLVIGEMLSLRSLRLVMFKVQPHLTFLYCHPLCFICGSIYCVSHYRRKRQEAESVEWWQPNGREEEWLPVNIISQNQRRRGMYEYARACGPILYLSV